MKVEQQLQRILHQQFITLVRVQRPHLVQQHHVVQQKVEVPPQHIQLVQHIILVLQPLKVDLQLLHIRHLQRIILVR